MGLSATELRIGNYHSYHIVDKLDDRVEWDEIYQIDFDDLRILSEFDCPEYKPIPLTEEWLVKFGFVQECNEWQNGVHTGPFSGLMILQYNIPNCSWDFSIGQYSDITFVKYVHEFQNLYFALTGEELIVSSIEMTRLAVTAYMCTNSSHNCKTTLKNQGDERVTKINKRHY